MTHPPETSKLDSGLESCCVAMRRMAIVSLVVVIASLCLVDGFSVSPGLAKAPAVPARRGGACSHASLGLVVKGGRRNRAASSRLGALDLKAQDCPGSATWREEGSPKAGTVLVAHDLEADHFFRQAAVRDRGAVHTGLDMSSVGNALCQSADGPRCDAGPRVGARTARWEGFDSGDGDGVWHRRDVKAGDGARALVVPSSGHSRPRQKCVCLAPLSFLGAQNAILG
jgi:hypothetical protein